ncbi:hypothetical protein ACFQH9_23805 [Pseudonocardia lutea]|uniref:DUF2867 domain-containing protein n=1 Tax=Pseudonocardia lutea TaxID=2172015 RepID=A0ABW1IC66_9PSEU
MAAQGVRGVPEIPTTVRERAALPTVDYADLFTVPAPAGDASAEHWARAMFGSVPDLGERLIWRVLLGLRLDPARGPDTVAGWRVTGREDDWIRMATAGPLLSANLVVTTGEGHAALATFVHFERRAGRLLWRPASAVHRALVPRVLRKAAARIDARSDARLDTIRPDATRLGTAGPGATRPDRVRRGGPDARRRGMQDGRTDAAQPWARSAKRL